ncbi:MULTISPECIES: head fiber protein [unclassified Micromonospora]|uniref:head fiber protein n=1 Tax=unclassified Micromonospora TaxID=2617518 RepID=UPI0033228DCA
MTRTVYGPPSGGGGIEPHAATHQPGGSDPMVADAAAGIASLRSLGTGATQAAAGNDVRLSDARPPTAHTHTAAQISDSTVIGRSVLTAADAAAARTAIGAGTSNLVLGATGTTAAAGNHTHAGLLTGSATAVNNSTATDVPGLVADFNNLLAALRARGIITGA